MQLWFLEGSPQVEDEVTVSFFQWKCNKCTLMVTNNTNKRTHSG